MRLVTASQPKRARARAGNASRSRATRSDRISEFVFAADDAFVVFCLAQLATKSGLPRQARRWAAQFERVLFHGTVAAHAHPLKRRCDRRVAFAEAIAEMRQSAAFRWIMLCVESRFCEVAGTTRRLNAADLRLFWRRTHRAARQGQLRGHAPEGGAR